MFYMTKRLLSINLRGIMVIVNALSHLDALKDYYKVLRLEFLWLLFWYR